MESITMCAAIGVVRQKMSDAKSATLFGRAAGFQLVALRLGWRKRRLCRPF
jgi:hypothetical protein